MEKPNFQISLDEFSSLFVVPAITGDELRIVKDRALYSEFMEEHERQVERDGGEALPSGVWHTLNNLRHHYSKLDEEKSIAFTCGLLSNSFMDEYALQILADWKLEVNPEESVKALLSSAIRYSSLFYVRAACLMKVAEICMQHDLTTEARRLYLAVLASTGHERIDGLFPFYAPVYPWVYMMSAQDKYMRIQDDKGRKPSHSSDFNPLSQAQEALLRLMLIKHNFGEEGNLVLTSAENAIRFRPARGNESIVGGTRFGGLPDLPPRWTWPGKELEFIAQFNLGEIAAFDHNRILPSHGLLSVFIRNLCYGWRNDGSDCLVSFYDGDISLLQRAEVPENFDVYGQEKQNYTDLMVYGCVSAAPYSVISLSKGFPQYGQSYVDDDFVERQNNLHHDLNPPYRELGWDYQLLGRYEEGARAATINQMGKLYQRLEDHEKAEAIRQQEQWILLVQIDSNPNIGMSFSDAGILFLMIHRDDLAARRFDRVFITMING